MSPNTAPGTKSDKPRSHEMSTSIRRTTLKMQNTPILRGSGVTAKSLNGPFQYVEQSLRCKTQWVETCKKLWNVHSNAWLIRDCSEHDPTMSPSVRNLPVRWPCFSFYFSSVFYFLETFSTFSSWFFQYFSSLLVCCFIALYFCFSFPLLVLFI